MKSLAQLEEVHLLLERQQQVETVASELMKNFKLLEIHLDDFAISTSKFYTQLIHSGVIIQSPSSIYERLLHQHLIDPTSLEFSYRNMITIN
jgi:hypothetical protein